MFEFDKIPGESLAPERKFQGSFRNMEPTLREVEQLNAPAQIMARLQQELGNLLAQTVDQLITDAIDARLGKGTWTLDSLKGRVQKLVYEWTPGELYLLDRMPLIVLYPPELDMSDDPAGPRMARYRVPYKRFDA